MFTKCTFYSLALRLWDTNDKAYEETSTCSSRNSAPSINFLSGWFWLVDRLFLLHFCEDLGSLLL